MTARAFRPVVALAALLLTVPAAAQSDKPMLLVTLKSMKDFAGKLKDLVKVTMEAAGQEAMWPMIQGDMEAKLGKEGEKIPGFDPSKPLGVRIMYKKPTPPSPIDGDILILLPTTDAAKLIGQGLPAFGFTSPSAGEGGLTTFAFGPTKAFAREASGYVAITIADADVVSTARLPKPADVFGSPQHDLSVVVNTASVPEDVIRGLITKLQALAPQQAATERDVQQLLDLESMEIHYDLDPAGGRLIVEGTSAAKSGTASATLYKGSTAGPLKSTIGLAPGAVFSAAMRGDYVAQSRIFENLLKGFKQGAAQGPSPVDLEKNEAVKAVLGLFDDLAKSDLQDLAVSVSGDGTLTAAFALKSTASFELKVGEVIDKVIPEIQKSAGENADKVKEMTKRDAVTIAGVKLSRIWIPLSPKAHPWAESIYLGVKDDVAFIAATMLESTETIENALKQKPAESEPLVLSLKLKELANAFRVLNYEGSGAIKVESKGGNPFKTTIEIPTKDIAALFKAGLVEKVKDRFAPAKGGEG